MTLVFTGASISTPTPGSNCKPQALSLLEADTACFRTVYKNMMLASESAETYLKSKIGEQN